MSNNHGLPPLPRCLQCGKAVVRIWRATDSAQVVGENGVLAVREDKRYWNKKGWYVWSGDYQPEVCKVIFCTVSCAAEYAVAVVEERAMLPQG